MKILLLNDNPVVRKLVALSAQKTKDDLNVIWSVDEVEDGAYDLLIVDDAHYSDESMAALKEKINYKTSLLMATRGNATPSGFDKVINKPFLPTDLVDLFAQIDKNIAVSTEEKSVDSKKSIVVDDIFEDDINVGEDIDLDDFDVEESQGTAVKTNVLDHEEVQELQDLLDDTDSFELDDELSLDGFMEDEEITGSDKSASNDDLLESLDDDVLQAIEGESAFESADNELDDAMEAFDFDEELLSLEQEPKVSEEESLDDEDLLGSLDDLLAFDEEEIPSEAKQEMDEELDDILGQDEEETVDAVANVDEDIDEFDALLLDDLVSMDEDEGVASLESSEHTLSDDELGELEQQIQDAVEDLGIEDLEQELDSVDMGDLDQFEGLSDLDSLSERDIKLAVGEEVEEEEPEIHIGHGDHESLDTEAFSEAMDESAVLDLDGELENINIDTAMVSASAQEHNGTPAEGIDALQALLKALSNEEVSKTLKGLSINININFGNEK